VLSVSAVDEQMRVEVRDAGPVERTGIRLKMVKVLAQRWGVETRLVDDQTARVVWFECAPTAIPRLRPGRDGSDTLDSRDAT
jgi:hypothetical protein